MGFFPKDIKKFRNPNLFPRYINAPQGQVTAIGGDNSLTVNVGLPVPAYANTDLNPATVAFLKYAVQITPVASFTGGNYARAYESGPLINFQYVSTMIQVAFKASGAGATQSQGTIVFDKVLTAGEKTYSVTFSLLKSGVVASTVNCTVLPAGEVR